MTPWQVLGVDPDVGVSDLRRRYAALIKEFRPETHPQDFARIREAYETALAFARRRALALEEEAAGTVDEPGTGSLAAPDEGAGSVDAVAPEPTPDPFPAAQQVEEPSIETGIAVGDAPIVTLPEAAEEDAEPALAARFRHFHAAAGSAVGTGDEAWLPDLRALLQARARASLDDSQALEFALMRWFVEAESPPLTLLFETGRVFDWHAHAVRLSSWLSPWALRQMEARLALSRDLVYARHFSGNRWLRALHSTRAGVGQVAFRPNALEALRWAERWRQASEDADAEALADCLQARTLKHLQGMSSTDLLVGVAVAAFVSPLVDGVLWGGAATALLVGMRAARQRIQATPRHRRLRQVADAIANNWVIVAVACFAAGLAGAVLLDAQDRGVVETVVGGLLVAPIVLLLAKLAWRAAAFVEVVVAQAFHWREAVDRLEFDRFLAIRATPDADQPFGARLGRLQRWRAIGAALRLQETEVAARARPPRIAPAWRSTRVNPWRLAWFAAWVVFAVARLAQSYGGRH